MTVVKEGREEDQAEDAAVGQADQVQSFEVQKQVNRNKVNFKFLFRPYSLH